MKTIAIKLPDSLLAQLETAAREGDENRSALVRKALEEFLSSKRKGKKPSCLDLARDLAGSVVGPSDLSTNRAHMDGYGR
ncbi:MAG: ribbon-helix-helix domain-containing protein [Thermodesulfobacteriota bacterium]